MKHFILTAALVAATFTAAFATGDPVTKAENEANMKAGRKVLVAKTTELEADLKQGKFSAAEAVSMDLLAIIRHGVSQTRTDANFLMKDGKHPEAKAQMQHMGDMEGLVHDYMGLTNDVKTNGPKLLDVLHKFASTY